MLLTLYTIFLTVVVSVAIQRLWKLLNDRHSLQHGTCNDNSNAMKHSGFPDVVEQKMRGEQSKNLQAFKRLYFKLQNIEEYPMVLNQARDMLIFLFSETISAAKNNESGILSIATYSHDDLGTFLLSKNDQVSMQWETYVTRRKAGSPREMFRDRDEATLYLRQMAPLKYVDGAWLGYTHRVTTPFPLRYVTKMLWQILSEELGDGFQERNHVNIYCDLMKDLGVNLPKPYTMEFTDPQLEIDDLGIWKAAVSQLLISLFPNEFLPEILGFNMAFEAPTLQTMIIAKELKELKINPYYFFLHISIDNADSGHTAIAIEAVTAYMKWVRKDGDATAREMWRRVQAGFILAESVMERFSETHEKQDSSDVSRSTGSEIGNIFERKAVAANKIHCNSQARIGGKTLDDWLNPSAFISRQWQNAFIVELSNSKPWVRKGDSTNSRLIQECHWGGKMFGSFTEKEVQTLKRWIDDMEEVDPMAYWSFTGRVKTSFDELYEAAGVETEQLVMDSIRTEEATTIPCSPSPYQGNLYECLQVNHNKPKAAKFFPLWFSHPCLLSGLVSIPARAGTRVGSASLRILRAQAGFVPGGSYAAGMDEVRRSDPVGIIELGLEMMEGLNLPAPLHLCDVLKNHESAFATKLLQLSARPIQSANLLLGLSWSFMQLHEVMIKSIWLPSHRQQLLKGIVQREQEELRVCLELAETSGDGKHDFLKGYSLGRREIEDCFN